jgi:putative hydrolase of the HAD superfamily
MVTTITIDFWNTLVDSSNGEARKRYRIAALRKALHSEGRRWDEEEIAAAFKRVYEAFEERWFGEKKTMSASESIALIWEFLGVEVSAGVHASVTAAFEESILHAMPALLPGAADAVAELACRYKLALVSDTALSPGVALREVLDRLGIGRYFTTMVFSDETGVAKPHPLAFETALKACGAEAKDAVHIGDIERTDVTGAIQASMMAVLFRGDAKARYFDPDASTEADAVASSWEDVVRILNGLQRVSP